MEDRKRVPSKITMDEQKALIALSKKDPTAFGRLYDMHFDMIFKYILYRVGNVTDAEDLTAQTFFNALKNLWKFRWTGISITAWLYRIATNEVNGFFRRLKKKSFTDIEKLSDRLPDEKNRPDHELEIAEETLAQQKAFLMLNRCVKELKPEEQSLITLRYFEKKPYAEIAKILRKKEGTLRMRAKRALEKLKIQLQKQGIDYETIGKSSIQHSQAGCEGGWF